MSARRHGSSVCKDAPHGASRDFVAAHEGGDCLMLGSSGRDGGVELHSYRRIAHRPCHPPRNRSGQRHFKDFPPASCDKRARGLCAKRRQKPCARSPAHRRWNIQPFPAEMLYDLHRRDIAEEHDQLTHARREGSDDVRFGWRCIRRGRGAPCCGLAHANARAAVAAWRLAARLPAMTAARARRFTSFALLRRARSTTTCALSTAR